MRVYAVSTTREAMQGIGKVVSERIPQGFGFAVLVFPFGDDDRRANYISNAQRSDVINSMKEFIIKCGAEEDWMKDIY